MAAKKPKMIRDGNADAVVLEGSSANIVFTPEDLSGNAIAKTDLISLDVTLYHFADDSIINNRLNEDALDYTADNGVLTWPLGPDDTAIVGDVAAGNTQTRCVKFSWSYNDGNSERVCVDVRGFLVTKVSSFT